MRLPVSRILVVALPLVLSGGAALAGEPTLGWSDVHDGGLGLLDVGTALLVDPEGDLVVAGESTGFDGSTDLFLRKLSRDGGGRLWEARWGDPGGNAMAMIEVVLDPHGDVIVGGYIRGCVG